MARPAFPVPPADLEHGPLLLDENYHKWRLRADIGGAEFKPAIHAFERKPAKAEWTVPKRIRHGF